MYNWRLDAFRLWHSDFARVEDPRVERSHSDMLINLDIDIVVLYSGHWVMFDQQADKQTGSCSRGEHNPHPTERDFQNLT